MSSTTPSQIARDALRNLAQRRVAPTPDNYAGAYCEISGRHDDYAGIALPRVLEHIAAEFAQADGLVATAARSLAGAMEQRDWAQAQASLTTMLVAGATMPDWSGLIRGLLRQWDMRHANLTAARKREVIEHVLTTCGSDAAKMHERLSNVVQSWTDMAMQSTSAPRIDLSQSQIMAVRDASTRLTEIDWDREMPLLLRELLAHTLEYAVIQRLGHAPELAARADALAAAVRIAVTRKDVNDIAQQLKEFWFKLEVAGEGLSQVMKGLLDLLRLLIGSIGAIADDGGEVAEQMSQFGSVLDGPITPRTVRDLDRNLRAVLHKRAGAKVSFDETRAALKAMLATFIDRLGTLAASTGTYHERIGHYARELQETDDISRIGSIVARLAQDTREMQTDIQRSHDEMVSARTEAAALEMRVQALEGELKAVSQLVRQDALTRALNRRGLDEAFIAEASRSDRGGRPMSLAILDIDNFKQLNDSLGHAAGDEALQHLANVTRNALRPSDVLSRFGGEEFVILFPETKVDEAVNLMVRAQRELTRHFFLRENERLLMTFSAGVAERVPGESQHSLLNRADAALYRAKGQGKNRVIAAD